MIEEEGGWGVFPFHSWVFVEDIGDDPHGIPPCSSAAIVVIISNIILFINLRLFYKIYSSLYSIVYQ